MNKLKILLIFTLLYNCAKAQEIEVKVVFNNTKDIAANSELITKIKGELVNTVKLSNAMSELDKFYSTNEDLSLTDKNLLVYISFWIKIILVE